MTYANRYCAPLRSGVPRTTLHHLRFGIVEESPWDHKPPQGSWSRKLLTIGTNPPDKNSV